MLATSLLAAAIAAHNAAPRAAASGGAADTVAAAPAAEATPAPDAPDFDFDLFGGPPPAAYPATRFDPSLDLAVASRRSMLQTHQTLGLTLLGMMAATEVIGLLNYRDLYGGGGRSGLLLWPHRISMTATTGAFLATGAYAMLAPSPYESSGSGVSTATVHKTGVAVASAGMLTQLVLGFITARQADAGNPRGLAAQARAHQIVGYVTLGSLAAAASAWLF